MTGQPRNFGTFAFRNIGAGQKAGQLSGGTYALSTLSTIPYVSLIGRSGREKLVSWNEVVVIEDGELITVKNACVHPGDIVINGGVGDYAAIPRRITIPVPLIEDEPGTWTPAFWLDTRRARCAYVALQGFTQANAGFLMAVGRASSTSFTGVASGDGPLPILGETNYRSTITIPANTNFTSYPLGMSAPGNESRAQALLDQSAFVVGNANINMIYDFGLYILEY